MSQDSQKKKKKNKFESSGPGDDCNCPVCIFSKSQAPGNPYDLKNCPKFKFDISAGNKKIKNKKDSGADSRC